ncbi:MAG: DUF4388 domain-containing protein [Planctomycetes bacterium]|nr:DUF4388 domain-containing protein [Planctomycetota bacterium]
MTVSGDLATIDLPDLLQNIEVHSRTGTLSLTGEAGAARIHFRDGHIAAMAGGGRSSLGERLRVAGYVTARRLDNAQRKARGSKRSVVELLIASRAVTAEDVTQAAADFLAEDVVNLIASAQGAFEFVEGEMQDESFDADELGLSLELPVAPQILEATRRADHWVEIRKFMPSDAMHFHARDGATVPEGAEDADLAEGLLGVLDGSRSVGEVAELFPDRRFHCYKLLAEFVRDRVARPTGVEDLLAIAESIEKREPERARELVRRGLDREAHHVELLTAEARLSERLGDTAGAASARKLVAHIHLDAGRTAEALEQLELAKRLAPSDPTIVERCLSVALLQGRRQDALQEGLLLVELYRAPGLHARAKDVLERLQRVDPDSLELELELAQSRVDCGETAMAVKQLLRRGKALVAAENYLGARVLFEAALDIEPGHREATLSVEMIDKEVYAQRREKKRRLVRLLITAASLAVAGLLLLTEFSARLAYVEIRSVVGRERMIEQQHYSEAISLWQEFARQHAFSLTAQLDVPRLVAELEQRRFEVEQAGNLHGTDERFR